MTTNIAPSIRVLERTNKLIEINIDTVIEGAENYRDEISAIKEATEDDVVHLTLNTAGGNLHTTAAILSVMRETPAHVICEAVGEVASAGTILFLAGDELRVDPYINFMVHTASHGSVGKVDEVYQHAVHSKSHWEGMMRDAYKHFLTDEEFTELFIGKDFHMGSEELIIRLEKRAESYKKERDAEEKAVMEEERNSLEALTKEELIAQILGGGVDKEGECVDESTGKGIAQLTPLMYNLN